MFRIDHTDESIRYTADIVAFCGNKVLLIIRDRPPYQGYYALPGGHVGPGESSRFAAAREAYEETNLEVDSSTLHRVDVYDEPYRDPRGRVVSVAYTVEVPAGAQVNAGDDAATAEWIDIDTALSRPMAFDHRVILNDACWVRV